MHLQSLFQKKASLVVPFGHAINYDGQVTFHTHISVKSEVGCQIYSPQAGTVLAVIPSETGLQITIQFKSHHLLTIYHVGFSPLQVGQDIQAGTAIGAFGVNVQDIYSPYSFIGIELSLYGEPLNFVTYLKQLFINQVS